jgi:hypothetical protein
MVDGFWALLNNLNSLPLQTLILDKCGLRAEYLEGLTFKSTALTSLSMAENIYLGHQGLQFLAEGLRESKVAHLNLSKCCMGCPGLRAILAALPDTSITTLDLRETFHIPCGDPMDGITLIINELPSLKLTTLDFRGHALSAWKVRVLTEAVKQATPPVTEVLVGGGGFRAPAALLALEEALKVKNAVTLVLQLSLVETGEDFELRARKISGEVVATVLCSSRAPAGRNIPRLLQESMRTRETLPEGNFNLKLVLPSGHFLVENGEPVVKQFCTETTVVADLADLADQPPAKKPRC